MTYVYTSAIFPSVGPIITHLLRYVTVSEKRRAMFCCTAVGNPRPGMTLRRKDGKSVRGEVTRSTYDTYITKRLVIPQVQTSDAGQYVCTAWNKLGNVHNITTLVVRGTVQLLVLINM